MIIAVIDDEINSRELLETLLKKYCPMVKSIATASSAKDGITLINKIRPDLIFLDIEMPGGNGFTLLDAFKEANFLTCFTTGYEKYALQAIKYGAFGYLLKPLDIEELRDIVNKVHLKIEKSGEVKKNDSIIVSENEVYHVIGYEDILQIEAAGNYTYIHHQSGKKVLSDRKLADYEGMLPEDQFFKTHRSHIVNLSKIAKYLEGRTGTAILINAAQVPIANRRLRDFHTAFTTSKA